MTPSLESLGFDKLSPEEKLDIADALWESVAEEIANAPLSEVQKVEINRRLALWEAEPNRTIPIREVVKEIRDKFGWPSA